MDGTSENRSGRPSLLSIQPLSLVAMLWKRKIAVLAAYSVFGAASAAVVWLWPDQYRAETVILVDGQKIPDKLVSPTVSAELQDRIATLSKQILSSTTLLKIIDDFGLYRKERATLVQEQILEKMLSDIQIKMETGWTRDRPGAFRVSYRGPSASVVAAVTTRLGNLFIEENLKSREVEAEGTSEFLRGRLQEARRVLDLQEGKIRQYKEQHNGELPGQAAGVEATLARLQSQLQTADDLLMRAQETGRMIENSLETAESGLALVTQLASRPAGDRSGSGDGAHAEEAQREKILRARLTELQARYSDNHPDVKAAKALLAQTAASVNSAPADPAAGTAPPPAGMPVQTVQLLARERERIAALKFQAQAAERERQQRESERKNLLADIAVYQKRLEQLPVREQEVSAMLRDYETSQMHYRSVLDKIFAADTAAEMERRQKAERFTILEAARVPERPYSPDRRLWGAAGTGISLVLAVILFLAWDIRRNKIMGEWELPASVAVLGRIGTGPDDSRPHQIALKHFRTVAAACTAFATVCVAALQIYRG